MNSYLASKPVRIVLLGNRRATNDALSILLPQGDFSLIQIPDVGACARINMRAQLWHSACSSIMHCHPGPMIFTGGIREDHEWVQQRRGVMLWVSDSHEIEVFQDFREDSPRWMEYSVSPLADKLASAIRIINMISRENKPHIIPPVYKRAAY